MDHLTDDGLLLELIEAVALGVLDRIGNDPDARYAPFKLFVELAQQVVQDGGNDYPVNQSWQ